MMAVAIACPHEVGDGALCRIRNEDKNRRIASESQLVRGSERLPVPGTNELTKGEVKQVIV